MNKITEIPFKITLEASGSGYSDAIDLAGIANEYVFSVQYAVTGTGAEDPTVTLEAMCSNDGINYVAYGTAIVENRTVAAGVCLPDTFTPPLCRWMKLKATETGGDHTATIAGVLCIQ